MLYFVTIVHMDEHIMLFVVTPDIVVKIGATCPFVIYGLNTPDIYKPLKMKPCPMLAPHHLTMFCLKPLKDL